MRLENQEQPQAAEFIKTWFSMEQAKTWKGAFVVATSRKLRVMHP